MAMDEAVLKQCLCLGFAYQSLRPKVCA